MSRERFFSKSSSQLEKKALLEECLLLREQSVDRVRDFMPDLNSINHRDREPLVLKSIFLTLLVSASKCDLTSQPRHYVPCSKALSFQSRHFRREPLEFHAQFLKNVGSDIVYW